MLYLYSVLLFVAAYLLYVCSYLYDVILYIIHLYISSHFNNIYTICMVYIRDKVNDLVDFPIEGLDLSKYVKSSQSSNEDMPAVYDLYGVSEHSGTMGGGHYTAKCKNVIDGKWYSFNDSFVRECSPESAISTEAYVLFYKRRWVEKPPKLQF